MQKSKKWSKFFMILCFVNFGLCLVLALLGDFNIGAITGWWVASRYAMDKYRSANAL